MAEDSRGRRIHIDRHVVGAAAKPGEMHLKTGRICISISFPLDRPMTPQQKQVDLNKARGEPSFRRSNTGECKTVLCLASKITSSRPRIGF